MTNTTTTAPSTPRARRRGAASVLVAIAALASGAFALSSPTSVAAAPRHGEVIPGSYIVTLADSSSAPSAAAAEHGRREGFAAKQVYESAIRGYAADLSPVAARRLAQRPDVASVEPDRFVSVAAKPTRSPSTGGPVQVMPAGVARVVGAAARTDVSVDVAVVDTGVAAHPDLNLFGGYNCQLGSRSAYGDANGHGTHVAGTVAAKHNGIGVVGVAPGARIHAVRVLDAYGNGSWSSIICGIDWVTRNASVIEVANLSLGGPGPDGTCASDALHAAICRSVNAGVTYVVAAGNDGVDTATYTPGTYDEVITVSAMTDIDGTSATVPTPAGFCWPGETDESFAVFSNFGTDVDLVAPGVCVRSTLRDGTYGEASGTSMATPHVAGAAAVYKAANPTASPAQVKQALLAAADTTFTAGAERDGIAEPLLRLPSA